MTQEENEKLMYASDEDIAFYLKCVGGLPTLAGLDGSGNGSDGIPLPYGLGAHSVRCLRQIVEFVKPKAIIEIGFNMGWSASLWLNIAPEAYLFSCDISDKKETLEAAIYLKNKYPFFKYSNRDSNSFKREIYSKKFDLIFIDGGHLEKDVTADIDLALELSIPYLAFDDILPEFGEVQKAIDGFLCLEKILINGNIALYKNKTL